MTTSFSRWVESELTAGKNEGYSLLHGKFGIESVGYDHEKMLRDVATHLNFRYQREFHRFLLELGKKHSDSELIEFSKRLGHPRPPKITSQNLQDDEAIQIDRPLFAPGD